jgi:hypothetical protein
MMLTGGMKKVLLMTGSSWQVCLPMSIRPFNERDVDPGQR